jgi:large subunit ribosomal protein L10
MPNQQNKDTLVTLKERLDSAKAIVLVDYKGINVEEVNELRRRFRGAEVDYFVAKNTLVKIALNELGIKELDEYLVGPTAVAVCKADEVAPARELVKFCKEVMDDKEFPKFKQGYIGSIVMGTDKLAQLAALPSREELLAKVLSGFNAPITGFVGVLQGVIRKFVYTVDAIAQQKAE